MFKNSIQNCFQVKTQTKVCCPYWKVGRNKDFTFLLYGEIFS